MIVNGDFFLSMPERSWHIERPGEILVEDDTFVLLEDHVREFCERLIAEHVPALFTISVKCYVLDAKSQSMYLKG